MLFPYVSRSSKYPAVADAGTAFNLKNPLPGSEAVVVEEYCCAMPRTAPEFNTLADIAPSVYNFKFVLAVVITEFVETALADISPRKVDTFPEIFEFISNRTLLIVLAVAASVILVLVLESFN